MLTGHIVLARCESCVAKPEVFLISGSVIDQLAGTYQKNPSSNYTLHVKGHLHQILLDFIIYIDIFLAFEILFDVSSNLTDRMFHDKTDTT